ncbi:WXG100 family type VII secretion target [Streptomyces sp. NPDC048623]|uniref:WXG100 family type VII secretion target n=1 Tax=Streptomyces sp. NPDC048623 TaxID=3155761 RepID=UPI003427E614
MASDNAGTRVRYESVQEMANRIRAVSNHIVQDLHNMETALKTVTDTWDGDAHREYEILQGKYNKRATDMKDRLEKIAQIVEQGKDSYRSTDVKASRLFTESY